MPMHRAVKRWYHLNHVQMHPQLFRYGPFVGLLFPQVKSFAYLQDGCAVRIDRNEIPDGRGIRHVNIWRCTQLRVLLFKQRRERIRGAQCRDFPRLDPSVGPQRLKPEEGHVSTTRRLLVLVPHENVASVAIKFHIFVQRRYIHSIVRVIFRRIGIIGATLT